MSATDPQDSRRLEDLLRAFKEFRKLLECDAGFGVVPLSPYVAKAYRKWLEAQEACDSESKDGTTHNRRL